MLVARPQGFGRLWKWICEESVQLEALLQEQQLAYLAGVATNSDLSSAAAVVERHTRRKRIEFELGDYQCVV